MSPLDESAADNLAPSFRLYSIVTAAGAVIMALEIISSRVLAPHFGNSVYVWGSIISVFLAALSGGYYLGGRLADREPHLAVLGRLLLLAALCQVVVLVWGTGLTAWLGELTGNSSGGTLLATSLLFGPPSLLLATVSPYAIRLATRHLSLLGYTAGRLFALSTGGSLFGTLGCTFLLIPLLDLHRILSLLLLVTAGTALMALTGRQRSELAAGLLLLAIGGAGLLRQPAAPAGKIHTRVTPYQTLEVTEIDGVRYLRGDRVLQSAVRTSDGLPMLAYLRYSPGALLLNSQIDTVLVLGMGGGAVGSYLRTVLPQVEIDYVDIDPAIPEIARQFLFFADHPLDRVHVGDARQFLVRSDRTWDYIYADTYIGLSVPFHLTTVEFVDEVRRRLAPDGVYGLNLAAGLDDPFSRAMLRTVSERFGRTYAFTVRAAPNVLVLATDAQASLPRDLMIDRARRLDGKLDLAPPLEAIAKSRLEAEIDPAEATLLSDGFAPANHLIRLGGAGLDQLSRPWIAAPPG